MIGNNNFIKVSRRALILLVLLALSIIDADHAHAALACNVCHSMPPTDSATGDRLPATGAFKGNHQGHSSSSVDSCVPCHGAEVSAYTASHSAPPPGSGSKPVIRLTSALNNYSIGHNLAAYSRGTFFNQTTIPPNPMGTCSSVNCHFETTTPAWGTTNFVAPTDCDKCHGAPPSGAATGAAGSHAKHDTYYPGVTHCQKCHPDNTTFQHATSAGNRTLAISFAASPNDGSGAYSGALDDYLPSQNPSETAGFGNCTATYCHSPGNKSTSYNPPRQVATWGGTLGCAGCHDATPSTGSHAAHVATTYGVPVECYKCHAETVTAGMTILSAANHVNRLVDIAFNSATTAVLGKYSGHLTPMQKKPGSGYAECENVYCHSSGQGAGGTGPVTYSTPKWFDSPSGKCATCHDSGFHAGSAITSGSHTKHIFNDFAGSQNQNICGVCHYGAGFADTACAQCHFGGGKLTTQHVDHNVNVSFITKFNGTYNGSPEPGDVYGSCFNSYCHSDGKATPTSYTTPTWGDPASGACGTCHGVTAAAPPASVPHLKHMGAANQYRYSCAECHSGKVQVTADSTIAPTFTNLTSHVNKVRNVMFDASNAFGTYSTATQSCRNLYCHSTGNTSVAAGDLPAVYNAKVYARQTWSGTVTCNSCHGRSTSNGMPDYANAGAAGSTTANSHQKHVTSSAIACVECHEKTTKSGIAIRSTIPGKHVNGTAHDVFFNLSGLSPSGVYDDALKKCSATYCHGTGASLAWGGTTYCNSCHSANAGTAGGGGVNNWGGTPLSAHKLHIEDSSTLPSKYTNYSAGNLSGNSTTYRFGCASCHLPGAGKASHVSGYASGAYRAQVFFGYTAPGKRPTYTYTGTAGTADNGFAWSNGNTACASTYCHSDGNGGTGMAVSWATTSNSATATRCKLCHAYTTASGTLISTYKHAKHAEGTTYSYSCAKCHNLTTTDGSAIADKTRHVNKKKDVAWDSLNSDGSVYVNVQISTATAKERPLRSHTQAQARRRSPLLPGMAAKLLDATAVTGTQTAIPWGPTASQLHCMSRERPKVTPINSMWMLASAPMRVCNASIAIM